MTIGEAKKLAAAARVLAEHASTAAIRARWEFDARCGPMWQHADEATPVPAKWARPVKDALLALIMAMPTGPARKPRAARRRG